MGPRMFLDYVDVPPIVRGTSIQQVRTASDQQVHTLHSCRRRGKKNVLEEDSEGESFSDMNAGEEDSDSSEIYLSARNHKRKGTAAKERTSKRRKTTARVVVPTPIVPPPGTSKDHSFEANSNFTFLHTHHCDCAALPVDHPQKHCKVLEYFDLYYSSVVNGIICYKHGCLVPLDRWLTHLQLVNKDRSHAHKSVNPRARKKVELDAMKAHVEASFHPVASIFDNVVLPAHLQDILPMQELHQGERPPILARYPCPVQGCSTSIAMSKNKTSGYEHDLSRNVVDKHGLQLRDFPKWSRTLVWTQTLRLTPHKYHTFQLPTGWTPPTKAPPYPLPTIPHPLHAILNQAEPESPPLPPQASWMHNIGWSSYRAAMPWTGAFLRRALERPSLSLASRVQGSLKWLELGLNIIGNILPHYLSNANLFLDECHPNIRTAINLG